MKTKLTARQAKGVSKELVIERAKLNKELSISEDLQHTDMIEEMKNHIATLEDMLQNGWEAPRFN